MWYYSSFYFPGVKENIDSSTTRNDSSAPFSENSESNCNIDISKSDVYL